MTSPNKLDLAIAHKILKEGHSKKPKGRRQRAAHLYVEATKIYETVKQLQKENLQLRLEIHKRDLLLKEIDVISLLLSK